MVLFTVVGLLALRNSTVSRRAVRLLMVVAIIAVPVVLCHLVQLGNR